MRIVNKTGGNGAGGNEVQTTSLKAGRTFFFSSWGEVMQFCKQHNISPDDIEAKGTTYSYEVPRK